MQIGPSARRSLAALAALPAVLSPASAAQLSSSYETRISIQTSCSVTASTLDFGTVGIITGTQTAMSAVNVTCSAGTPFALSFGSSGIATSFTGQMANGANTVTYNAVLLGPNAGVGSATRTILGNLPLQPAPPSGTYVDTRTIYLNY